MAGFTVAARTIAWSDRLVDALAAEIAALDADILVITEGTKGEARAAEFFAAVAPGHRLVVRGDAAGRSSGIQGSHGSGS